MELILVLMLIAILLGITPLLDRARSVEESWPDVSYE